VENHTLGDFKPRVNVAAIEGGWPWRGARTPDGCSIYMDVRTLPDDLPVAAYNEVREVVNAAVRANPQLEGTKVEIFVSAPGTSIPDDHELVKQVISAHDNQLGNPPEMGVETWYSDAGHMNRYGIPTVNYGSAGRIRSGGGGFSTHQGEHVHIGDMVDITRVYVEVLLNICGVAD
jgi:acetylornithine deacetylase/succinyl-diaminopimelate desuccinylase-like protein